MSTPTFAAIEAFLSEAGVTFDAIHEGLGSNCTTCPQVTDLAA